MEEVVDSAVSLPALLIPLCRPKVCAVP